MLEKIYRLKSTNGDLGSIAEIISQFNDEERANLHVLISYEVLKDAFPHQVTLNQHRWIEGYQTYINVAMACIPSILTVEQLEEALQARSKKMLEAQVRSGLLQAGIRSRYLRDTLAEEIIDMLLEYFWEKN